MASSCNGAWNYGLRAITPGLRMEHDFLSARDRCFFLFEYHLAGPGPVRGPVNRLIGAFKAVPLPAGADPVHAWRKRRAIEALALALRACVPRPQAEAVTWIPIPPSKARGDPQFDGRLERVLALAFSGYDIDVRPLLRMRRSAAADHAAGRRSSAGALSELLAVEGAVLAAAPPRGRLVLFDDVLTSGKHFCCCREVLRRCCPGLAVDGVFLARRTPGISRHGMAEPRWLGEA